MIPYRHSETVLEKRYLLRRVCGHVHERTSRRGGHVPENDLSRSAARDRIAKLPAEGLYLRPMDFVSLNSGLESNKEAEKRNVPFLARFVLRLLLAGQGGNSGMGSAESRKLSED